MDEHHSQKNLACYRKAQSTTPLTTRLQKKRGTGSQSLQLIDVFEECEEAAADLGLSSWDTVKAFDSISRALAKISLYRMGVPKEVCEDIIDIDEGGSTFIRCPLARKKGSDAFTT